MAFAAGVTFTSGSLGAPLAMASPLATRFDGCQHALSHFWLVRAHSELQLDLARDDAVLGAAVDRADSNDDRIERIVLTRNNGLQGEDRASSNYNGINRVLRPPAVAALPENGDVHRVSGGQRVTGVKPICPTG